MNVPFVDLKMQYQNIKSEIDSAIAGVISESAFIKGKYVAEFEKKYAEQYGVNYCLGVANGTDAIYIALKALGIGAGNEVITVANTWIATSETISQTGAKPVFVDIEPDYYTIDPDLIEAKINERTKAIIPVHLYGQSSDMAAIRSLCDKYNLYLIEDCAQAHFVEFQGKRVGTFGDVATFSFYPGKNLGAYGDAGAVITNDEALDKRMRMFANHGALKKHNHEIEGINSRLDGLQAAILSAKLDHIHAWNSQRHQNAGYYNKILADVDGITTPKIRQAPDHIFHLYVIRTQERDALKSFLHDKGIQTAIHYPTPLPLLQAYRDRGYTAEDFPVAAAYKSQILSLPMFPELTERQMDYVAESIKEFFAKHA